MKKIRSLLVANRSEIAIRVMRAASELGIRTVGIYANEDRFALHRFKADESYLVGEGKKPIEASTMLTSAPFTKNNSRVTFTFRKIPTFPINCEGEPRET